MFPKFSEEAQKALLLSKEEMLKLKHPYVGSEHLILAILSNEKSNITKKLKTINIDYERYKNELINIVGIGKNSNSWFLYTPLLKRIIENAIFDSHEKKEEVVTAERLFLSLLEEGDGVGIRILINLHKDIDGIYNMFNNNLIARKSSKEKKLLVNDFSVNFNKKVLSGEVDPVVCRDSEVDRVINILSRRCKNNPLLIGEAGVGKTAIVEELARRIVLGEVPKFLHNKTILSVSISSMVAGTKYRGEFEERINKILKEVEANKNIILFIDEIHTIVGAGGAEGAIDASNILKPALARGKIRIIGATTNYEYRISIEKDKALDRRFQKINIKEPSNEDTKKILLKLKKVYSDYHKVFISDEVIDYIINLTDKYITNQKNPDKSIDILDEVCAKASLKVSGAEKKLIEYNNRLKEIKKLKNESIVNGNFKDANKYKIEEYKLEDTINKISLNKLPNIKQEITKGQVDEIIELKTKIPIYKTNSNNTFISKLEKYLNKKVIGQEEIIKDICKYTKLIKSSLGKDKPYSFLFLGKTGVGKTLLVKEYAKYLYSSDNYIRLDMSEYKEESSISKIIGSAPGYIGYDDSNYLVEHIRNNPHTVLLLDEIEKANRSVIKLFLQVLDEGFIHDSSGRLVDFRHTIIFMTSNLGSEKDHIGFTTTITDNDLKEFFNLEFLNRIDKIYRFNKLDYNDVKIIVKNKLKIIKNKYQKKDINITITNSIIEKIIEKSEYQKYGARKIDKVIDELISSFILDMIVKKNTNIKLKELEYNIY